MWQNFKNWLQIAMGLQSAIQYNYDTFQAKIYFSLIRVLGSKKRSRH